jgi:glutamate/tyrosine decarboxylase-like PLP-dependent enzyme
MSVQAFGLGAFRAAIARNLELASYAEELVRGHATLTFMAPATLGIVCVRREWPGCDEAETERRGIALADALEHGGTALVSTTRLAGRHAIRLCVLNPPAPKSTCGGLSSTSRMHQHGRTWPKSSPNASSNASLRHARLAPGSHRRWCVDRRRRRDQLHVRWHAG